MKRREFIALLSGTIAWPLAAFAEQTSTLPRVGLLWPGSAGPDPVIDAFSSGLREHGYAEGQNIVVERVDAGLSRSDLPNWRLNWFGARWISSSYGARRRPSQSRKQPRQYRSS